MRTRCPRCTTAFRITPEQLRARGGQVRCGHCQSIFNALDTLVEEPPTPAPEAQSGPLPAVVRATRGASESRDDAFETSPAAEQAVAETANETLSSFREFAAMPDAEATAPYSPPAPEEPAPQSDAPPPRPTWLDEAADDPPPDAAEARLEPSIAPPDALPATEETPEETADAAREAGLVAARELNETPAFDRWAAGPLAGIGGLESEARKVPLWPFALAAALLIFILSLQMLLHFRTDIVQRLPDALPVYTALGVKVPLPREADKVGIEASDLQSDLSRGLLVLQATLRNRAPYAQAWPALELTLTDTHDAVVARRVLTAREYLAQGVGGTAFPANGEIAIRLWIETKDISAAGYRLYLFYP